VLSAGFSGRRAFDCSAKERAGPCGYLAEMKGFVLHNFFTRLGGE
jgi:hypothetical protein